MIVDLCFVMDCTGKKKKDEQGGLSRKKHIDYGDTPDFEILNFTEDVNVFKEFLGKLSATGGGDECEDVIGGLEKCVGLKWSSTTKVLFHIVESSFFLFTLFEEGKKGDAPPHNRKYHDGAGDSYPDDTKRDHTKVLKELQKKGNMRYYIAKLHDSLNKVWCVCFEKIKSAIEGKKGGGEKKHVSHLHLCWIKKKMIRVFKATGHEMNLTVEEHEMPDIMHLFEGVVRSVTDAIKAIRVSKKKWFISYMSGESDIGIIAGKRKRHPFKAFAGIDFGTDGTGFAYGFSDGKIYTEQKWEGCLLAEVKNKTNILLDSDGEFIAFGQEATERYVSSADRSLEFYERFKMALYG
ncbi:hypothetical protein RFI_07581 [Reticulomyxa filosa]|uniref:Uncharacterized protein n=1 Tax=Reticulomyxa filosa TaxID=46433 RepID=X6NW92_RETFI|nr:hypothetical protein RFI_07581 [Reticulomyxa filosa]|eukprot:ETO29542.1 hypothetical protein RFI_07581 [Reticulomyxa filosa]